MRVWWVKGYFHCVKKLVIGTDRLPWWKCEVKVNSITSISTLQLIHCSQSVILVISWDIQGKPIPGSRKWDKFFAFRLSNVTTLVASLWQMFTPSTKRDRNSISILDIFCKIRKNTTKHLEMSKRLREKRPQQTYQKNSTQLGIEKHKQQ